MGQRLLLWLLFQNEIQMSQAGNLKVFGFPAYFWLKLQSAIGWQTISDCVWGQSAVAGKK